MTHAAETRTQNPNLPPAFAALTFVFGVAVLGFVAMFSAAALA